MIDTTNNYQANAEPTRPKPAAPLSPYILFIKHFKETENEREVNPVNKKNFLSDASKLWNEKSDEDKKQF